MPAVTVIYGEEQQTVSVPQGALAGEAITATSLPLEQPCAGRGTCGKCKILLESGAYPPDDIERDNLTTGELAVGNRLACRAKIETDCQITLAPIVVYSNKIFKAGNRHKRDKTVPLGLAIDLGSTTVAALLTMLDNGEVVAGGASLNQQAAYGADVISRLGAARSNPVHAERLYKLTLASINQAVDSLKLSAQLRQRIERVTIVCNVAMHHLLARLPLDSLAVMPFQPYQTAPIVDAAGLMGGIFPAGASVSLPPLIGGFVGSDALACLAYFDFDRPPGPIAAVDLGTNGEVMVTDGQTILTASTAAGPAFEGVNISCGTRAVDGAIVNVGVNSHDFVFETIANEPPVGLTGSGLITLTKVLLDLGVVEPNGRISPAPPRFAERLFANRKGTRFFNLTADGALTLSQWDIRELQKAKGAIRAAIDILMERLHLQPNDLERIYLTGSFGGQVDVDAILAIGMIPPVRREAVSPVANGAGLGAATFLTDAGFARAEALAAAAQQVDLDLDRDFNLRYAGAMALSPDNGLQE